MLGQYAIVLAATCLLELPVYWFLLRNVLSGRQVALVCLGLNIVTHPVVWFGFPHWIENYWAQVAVAETFAIAVEALLLAVVAGRLAGNRISLPLAVGSSFAANAFSAGVGLVFFASWAVVR